MQYLCTRRCEAVNVFDIPNAAVQDAPPSPSPYLVSNDLVSRLGGAQIGGFYAAYHNITRSGNNNDAL